MSATDQIQSYFKLYSGHGERLPKAGVWIFLKSTNPRWLFYTGCDLGDDYGWTKIPEFLCDITSILPALVALTKKGEQLFCSSQKLAKSIRAMCAHSSEIVAGIIANELKRPIVGHPCDPKLYFLDHRDIGVKKCIRCGASSFKRTMKHIAPPIALPSKFDVDKFLIHMIPQFLMTSVSENFRGLCEEDLALFWDLSTQVERFKIAYELRQRHDSSVFKLNDPGVSLAAARIWNLIANRPGREINGDARVWLNHITESFPEVKISFSDELQRSQFRLALVLKTMRTQVKNCKICGVRGFLPGFDRLKCNFSV